MTGKRLERIRKRRGPRKRVESTMTLLEKERKKNGKDEYDVRRRRGNRRAVFEFH